MGNNWHFSITLFVFVCWSASLQAQISLQAKGNNGIQRVACGTEIFFTDDNSIDGVLYKDNLNEPRTDSIVLCAAGSKSSLTLYFHEFGVANGDNLEMYDGDITSGNPSLIKNVSGNGVSATGGWVASNCHPSFNPSGCLSFIFRTNGDGIKSIGWRAKVVCDPSDIDIKCTSNITAQQTCPISDELVSVRFTAPTFTSCGGSAKLNIALKTCEGASLPSSVSSGQTVTGKFPIGQHEVIASLPENDAINCRFVVTIEGADISCKRTVATFIEDDCKATIQLKELLAEDCYGKNVAYHISINDRAGERRETTMEVTSSSQFNAAKWVVNGDWFECQKRYRATVTRTIKYDDCSGSSKEYSTSCNTTIRFNDVQPPTINARSYGAVNACGSWTDEAVRSLIDYEVANACGVTITSISVGEFKPSFCGTGSIPITIEAEDQCGNIGRDFVNVSVRRPRTMIRPRHVTVTCGQDYGPTITGYPWLDTDGNGVGDLLLDKVVCDYNATFTDELVYSCGSSFQVKRHWLVHDLCSNKPPKELAPQMIESVSTECDGPCDQEGNLLVFDVENVARLSGALFPKGKYLEDVTIEAVGANGYTKTTQGQADGSFDLFLPKFIGYQLRATKETGRTMGVSINDLIAILKHIKGTQPLEDNTHLLAADVNASGTITAMDIVQLRQLLLDPTANDELVAWRFLTTEQLESVNWSSIEAKRGFTIDRFEEAQSGFDFQVIKMGDVDDSFKNLSSTAPRNRLNHHTVTIDNPYLQKGMTIHLPLVIHQKDIAGIQLSLQGKGLEIVSIQSGLADEQHFLQSANNQLNICWDKWTSVSHAANHLIQLELKATTTGYLSDLLQLNPNGLTPQVVTTTGDTKSLQLSFEKDMTNLHNSPNPFSQATYLHFNLPKSQIVQLKIYDTQGQLIWGQSHAAQKGNNRFLLESAVLHQKGLLFYELHTENGVRGGKMLLLE